MFSTLTCFYLLLNASSYALCAAIPTTPSPPQESIFGQMITEVLPPLRYITYDGMKSLDLVGTDLTIDTEFNEILLQADLLLPHAVKALEKVSEAIMATNSSSELDGSIDVAEVVHMLDPFLFGVMDDMKLQKSRILLGTLRPEDNPGLDDDEPGEPGTPDPIVSPQSCTTEILSGFAATERELKVFSGAMDGFSQALLDKSDDAAGDVVTDFKARLDDALADTIGEFSPETMAKLCPKIFVPSE